MGFGRSQSIEKYEKKTKKTRNLPYFGHVMGHNSHKKHIIKKLCQMLDDVAKQHHYLDLQRAI